MSYLAERGVIICTCGCEGAYFLSDRKQLGISVNIDELVDQVIKNVYDGESNSKQQNRQLIQNEYAKFREAIKEGTGKLAVAVEYGTPNHELLKNLQYNVAVFSAFKKHDMMGELVKHLRDDKGNLKSFSEFRKGAKDLVGTYKDRYLQTEYDTAVRSSRMAAQWESFQRTKRLYPNLKYIVSRSANKREDHLGLVGTILPIDHPFWIIHFPPNGYGCKCSARQTDEKPTEEPVGVEVDKAFAFNPGIEGKVFDVGKHPYAQLPQKEYKTVAHEARGAYYHYEKHVQEKQWMDEVAGKQKVKVDRLRNPVEFNRTSFEKNMRLDNGVWDRLNLLNNIKEVLQHAEYLHEEEPKSIKKHVLKYHLLSYKKNEKEVTIYVQENKNGQHLLYSLHTKKASE